MFGHEWDHIIKLFLITGKPELKDLLTELYMKVPSKWEDIGILLGIDDGHLKQIRSNNTSDSTACLREMLRAWLNTVEPPPSWSKLADALEKLGEETLASSIRSKYLWAIPGD